MRHRFLTGSLFIIAVLMTVFLNHRWWKRLNQPAVLCPGCNVIIIDIDTFRADAFDCKGEPGDSGYPPNLCEFVKDAFKFENNFSQSYWTLPSMVSTHTGLYPPEHEIEKSLNILSSDIPMMPEILQKNGYHTFRLGFMNNIFSISKEGNTDRGYELFVNSEKIQTWEIETKKMMLSRNPFYALFYFSGLHAPYILDDTNQIVASLVRNSFFPITDKEINNFITEFLIKNYDDIFTSQARFHKKSQIANFFFSLNDDNEKAKKYLKNDWDTIYNKFFLLTYENAVDQDSRAAEIMHFVYNVNVKKIDTEFGLFIDGLKQLGVLENSVIVFMSEHGEAFNEHGFIEHIQSPGSLYNELLHVPLYILIPGIRGKEIKKVTQNIDIFPTLFEIIGIGLDDSVLTETNHGKSLVPLINERKWWSNLQDRFAISFSDSLVSIQNNKWKMIADLSDTSRLEVYDLKKDPQEKINISSSTSTIATRLMTKLELTFGFNLSGLGLSWKDRFKLN